MLIKSKTVVSKRPYTEQLKNSVLVSIDHLTANKDITFDTLRQHVHLTDKELPNGWIHQIAADAEYIVTTEP